MPSKLGHCVKRHHLLLAAGVTAAVAGFLWYLVGNEKLRTPGVLPRKKRPDEYSKDDVLRVLKDISVSQEKLRAVLKEFTQQLLTKELSLEEIYYRVERLLPEDPLELNNLSMKDFDEILDIHQNTPEVREAIETIMGAPGPVTLAPETESITKEQIIAIHEFMVVELTKLVEEFEKLDQSKFRMKTITIAAQAQVGAQVEKKFGLTSDEIESGVLLHHKELNADPTFGELNLRMQSVMRRLTGDEYPGMP